MMGERDDWMPRPDQADQRRSSPCLGCVAGRAFTEAPRPGRRTALDACLQWNSLHAALALRRRHAHSRSCVRTAPQPRKCLPSGSGHMYELVSLINRAGADRARGWPIGRALRPIGQPRAAGHDHGRSRAHERPSDGAKADGTPHPGSRGHAAEHHRDRVGGVRAQRPGRRARSTRSPRAPAPASA